MAVNSSGSATPIDNVLIGSAYLFPSVAALVFYIPCLKVIWKDHELKKHSCFRMMFQLGLCDVWSLFAQAMCGYFILTDLWLRIPHWFNRIFSALVDGFAWHAILAFIHSIAINRAVTMCGSPQLKERLTSEKATKLWIAFCWMYGVVWFCIEMCPWGGFIYYPSIYAFYFDGAYAWYKYLKEVTKWEAIFHLLVAAIWYVVIVCYVRHQRGQMSQESAQNQTARTKETQIVKQAAVICIYPLIWDQWWHLAPVLAAGGFKYAFVIGNLFWISNAALNPAVYLTMNKTIGRKVRGMFGMGDHGATSVAPAQSRGRKGTMPSRRGTMAKKEETKM